LINIVAVHYPFNPLDFVRNKPFMAATDYHKQTRKIDEQRRFHTAHHIKITQSGYAAGKIR
jgi:hypothetical protein